MNKSNSLVLRKLKDCAFCDYISGKRDYSFVYKDSQIAVMVTREQRGYGHLLVSPIRHTESILDLEPLDSENLLLAVQSAARAIDLTFHRPGISVWQNNGQSAGQAINHLHFHVAGTLDKGGTSWGDVPELSLADTELIANKLRENFSMITK